MRIGFGRCDITPPVGVELCGFGPYIGRKSTSVRDPLWAKAMAVEVGGDIVVIVSCDLIGTSIELTNAVRALISGATGVGGDAIMLHCTHTHSGPATVSRLIGWGEIDRDYLATLPKRIAAAAVDAIKGLTVATVSHAEVPCEGIGQNREYDRDALPLAEVLCEDWRPLKPELTDTTCHVLKAEAGGRVLGFFAYFGCHPVVCCSFNHQIHGDFCGVAMNAVERDHPGSVGLFLQGAQGDVNSCAVHKEEQESLHALDVIAARFAASVRNGLRSARPISIDRVAGIRRHVRLSRMPWDLGMLKDMLARKVAAGPPPGDPKSWHVGVEAVYIQALRRMIAEVEAGAELSFPLEFQGLRCGPIAFLGGPVEIFQALKNEVTADSRAPIPLVMSFANDYLGYAADRKTAAKGGYAAEWAPLINALVPFANAHDEVVDALLDLDRSLDELCTNNPIAKQRA